MVVDRQSPCCISLGGAAIEKSSVVQIPHASSSITSKSCLHVQELRQTLEEERHTNDQLIDQADRDRAKIDDLEGRCACSSVAHGRRCFTGSSLASMKWEW